MDKLRVVHPTKANLRRVENREAFSTVDAWATCCVGFVVLSASAALSSAFGYRFASHGESLLANARLAGPAKGTKRSAPLHPGLAAPDFPNAIIA